MDLIQYLSQGKDKKGKLIKRKGKKKLDRIPRRGRGFGQRHRAYREKKEKDSSVDKQLLALLTISNSSRFIKPRSIKSIY